MPAEVNEKRELVSEHPCGRSGPPSWEAQSTTPWPIRWTERRGGEGQTDVSTSIAEAIASSKSILGLEDDWDGEGSPGYQEATWGRAVSFLRELALGLRRRYHVAIDAPRILPSAGGSIDLHWKTASYELLVNVPADPDKPASYYGDNARGNMPIEKTCDPWSPDPKLLAWMYLFK